MSAAQRVAVIGAGVSGLVCADLLAREYDVTVFEAQDRAGGHTHTHEVEISNQRYHVDTGFIVFNRHNYPLFSALLDDLSVPSQPTQMTFSAVNEASGTEYAATSFDTLFSQRKNLLRPRFWRMLTDIRRFYRAAPALLAEAGPGPSTGQYLADEGFGRAFVEDHLLPMASALWSAPASQVLDFPLRYMLQFFDNHRMLQISGRPQWRVVKGGSGRYVDALLARFDGELRLNCPARSVTRSPEEVRIETDQGPWRGDLVVMACHGDQALGLLTDADEEESALLGQFQFQRNEVVLHTDESLLPQRPKAWSSWNARIVPGAETACTVTYNMNILQNIRAPVTFCVTLNQSARIDEAKILRRMTYEHPIYTHSAVQAQGQLDCIQGRRRVFWCGAWQGWGFHEDGVASAHRAVAAAREVAGA